MLLVDTYIGPSNIQEIGLFAAENIKKGAPIWEFNPNTTQVFWKKQFLSICSNMSLPAILEFINHSYIKDGNVYYLNDRTKFINHSVDPSIAFKNSKLEIAIKNIKKGEEITENYALSYDKSDFFNWDLAEKISSKEVLVNFLSKQLTKINLPQQGFLVNF